MCGGYVEAGGDRLVLALRRKRLRILAYHGVCQDYLRSEPWVPGYLVTRSAFEAQLAYLKRHATILPLGEAVQRLATGELRDRSVCLTFDDGYANNLHLAYPILKRYEAPATVFLASSYIDSGEIFPFDRLRLIHLFARSRPGERRQAPLDYATNPVDTVVSVADPWWSEVETELSEDQRETLRPLRRDELQDFDPDLVEFGAHTHSHCILHNEERGRREAEIRGSIERIREQTRRPVELFSYPNGQRGDFDERDKAILRSEGIRGAVTTITGTNPRACDPLELRRYSIGLYHTEREAVAELTGFASLSRSLLA